MDIRDAHLPDLDQDTREHLTAKSHLYGLLSARSGKDAVVRLREHFRCVPEIIHWSSTQFYGEAGRPGLVALRERQSDALDPLRVVHVSGGFTEGKTSDSATPSRRRSWRNSWFAHDVADYAHVLRDHRNLIHPRKHVAGGHAPDSDTVRIAWNVVVAALNDLADSTEVAMPTPEGHDAHDA